MPIAIHNKGTEPNEYDVKPFCVRESYFIYPYPISLVKFLFSRVTETIGIELKGLIKPISIFPEPNLSSLPH